MVQIGYRCKKHNKWANLEKCENNCETTEEFRCEYCLIWYNSKKLADNCEQKCYDKKFPPIELDLSELFKCANCGELYNPEETNSGLTVCSSKCHSQFKASMFDR